MPYKDQEKQKEARKKYEEKRKKANGTRHRVWTGICYPDSVPDGWQDELSEMHMKIWVSPPHDSDKWTKADERKNPKHVAGTLKKEHRHYIAEYETPVDMATFVNDFAFLNGSSYVKAVRSLRSMVRYLAHLDDPDKAQYEKDEILVFGGANLDVVAQLGTRERHEALRSMRLFIRENCIYQFCDFVDYCDDCESEWSQLLDDNSSYVIEKYIKSMYLKHKDESEKRYRISEFTGEVVEDI